MLRTAEIAPQDDTGTGKGKETGAATRASAATILPDSPPGDWSSDESECSDARMYETEAVTVPANLRQVPERKALFFVHF